MSAAHAEDGILHWHWWTRQEPAGPADALWPPQLPVLPARLREDRCPHPEPVHLGFVPNGTTG